MENASLSLNFTYAASLGGRATKRTKKNKGLDVLYCGRTQVDSLVGDAPYVRLAS